MYHQCIIMSHQETSPVNSITSTKASSSVVCATESSLPRFFVHWLLHHGSAELDGLCSLRQCWLGLRHLPRTHQYRGAPAKESSNLFEVSGSHSGKRTGLNKQLFFVFSFCIGHVLIARILCFGARACIHKMVLYGSGVEEQIDSAEFQQHPMILEVPPANEILVPSKRRRCRIWLMASSSLLRARSKKHGGDRKWHGVGNVVCCSEEINK